MGWIILFSIEGLSVIWDLRTGKIPNFLIVTGTLLGISWQLCQNEFQGIFCALSGALMAVFLLGILHCFKMIGAGDVKLFMVAGIILGPVSLCKLIFLSFLIGTLISVGVLIRYRILLQRLQYFWQYVTHIYSGGVWEPYIKEEKNKAYIHFSVPVVLGTLLLRGGIL